MSDSPFAQEVGAPHQRSGGVLPPYGWTIILLAAGNCTFGFFAWLLLGLSVESPVLGQHFPTGVAIFATVFGALYPLVVLLGLLCSAIYFLNWFVTRAPLVRIRRAATLLLASTPAFWAVGILMHAYFALAA